VSETDSCRENKTNSNEQAHITALIPI